MKLLFDSLGTEISSLQKLVGDLSPLSTPVHMKTHISNAFMTLSPDASLVRILPVALLKLVTLRFSNADLLFPEHFGDLMWKAPVIVSIGKVKHSSTFGGIILERSRVFVLSNSHNYRVEVVLCNRHNHLIMMLIPASMDLWARTTSLTSLMNSDNSLCTSIDLLLHPSILSADLVKAIFMHLLHIYYNNNINSNPYHMAVVFFILIQQNGE